MLAYSTYLGGRQDRSDGHRRRDRRRRRRQRLRDRVHRLRDFPTTPGAFDTSLGGGQRDAFVTKLAPDGASLVYSTYLGGSGIDGGVGIAVDAAGSAYVTGTTDSATSRPRPAPSTRSYNGGATPSSTKLAPDGSGLVYSTYLGGSSGTTATASRWTPPATPT